MEEISILRNVEFEGKVEGKEKVRGYAKSNKMIEKKKKIQRNGEKNELDDKLGGSKEILKTGQ